MAANNSVDVLIIGGSYAGLSAAMALGRALRSVVVVDSGAPCNRSTPYSHNLITHDGTPPRSISVQAKQQVLRYNTVSFYEGLAVSAERTEQGFAVQTQDGTTFEAKKLIVATGLRDIMPDIPGFAECWGISVIHCPYCHGYEVRHGATGILGNGEQGFEIAKMVRNWTKNLTLFTNGESTFTPEQAKKLIHNNISVVEAEVSHLAHDNGTIRAVVLCGGASIPVQALYARPHYVQHSDIPERLGCAFTEQGLLQVELQKTTVPGVFACGDNSSFRAVSAAIYTGTVAGAAVNRELTDEEF